MLILDKAIVRNQFQLGLSVVFITSAERERLC